jgi:PAS domain S-box-containing protein
MRRALIVDDKPENLYLLRALLQGHGFLVEEARHGAEALVKGRQTPPALVVSDLLMPVMDGYTLLRHWKADKRLQLIPFIVYTATYTDPKDERLAMNLGADAFIIKPAEPEQFMSRLHEVMDRSNRHESGAAVQPLDENVLLQDYGEVVVRKLEEKILQVEQANQALRTEIAERKKAEAALRSTETQFRLWIEGVKDNAIFMLDADGKVVSWNAGAKRIYGYEGDEIIGQHASRFFLPADQAAGAPQRELETALLKGRNTEAGWRVRKDGSRFWADGSTTAIRDEAEDLQGFINVVRDSTERREVYEALLASEERYRTLIDATSAIVWNTPSSGEFESEQPGWTAFTGLSFDQIKGWGWLEAVHPDDREVSARMWGIACKQRTVFQGSHRIRRHDGVYRHMAVRACPILRSDGTVREWVGAHTDVTDQKRAESDLQLRERAILAATQGLLITDPSLPDNGIVYASPGFERMTGYRLEEVQGKNCWFLQGKETEPAVVKRLQEAIRAGQHCSVEMLNYRKDGTSFWNELSISPIQDSSGKVTHFVGVQTDVTARRNLEEQFRQSQKMEAIGQLAGGVAHDFNNLLTIINGYSDLLLQSLAPADPCRELVNQILGAGERSAGLTRQLLAFSRQQVMAPRILDLNALVADTEKMLRRLIGADICLTTILEPNLGAVKVDPGQIDQVLMNLAVNARDAMPTGGQLTIETFNVDLDDKYSQQHVDASPGSYVLLMVSDTGCGIPPEIVARIFEPFFTTKGLGKGTGLGLSTVYGIIKQSGGHISVYSSIGFGTVFKVYLPRVDKPVEAPIGLPGQSAPTGGTETILLVEDDEGVRSLSQHMLTQLGYTLLTAANGEQALRLAAQCQEPIDLLITDIVMPGEGGRVVAERLAKQHPGLRVLFVSGYTDDAFLREGIPEELHFLQKPFTWAALAHKVRTILDKPISPTGL